MGGHPGLSLGECLEDVVILDLELNEASIANSSIQFPLACYSACRLYTADFGMTLVVDERSNLHLIRVIFSIGDFETIESFSASSILYDDYDEEISDLSAS